MQWSQSQLAARLIISCPSPAPPARGGGGGGGVGRREMWWCWHTDAEAEDVEGRSGDHAGQDSRGHQVVDRVRPQHPQTVHLL